MSTPEQQQQYEIGEYVFMNKDGRILTGFTPTTRREPVKVPSTDLTHQQQRAILAQIPLIDGDWKQGHHNDPGFIFPVRKDDNKDVPNTGSVEWVPDEQVRDLGAQMQANHRKAFTRATVDKVWANYNSSTDPHAKRERSQASKVRDSEELGDESILVDKTLSPEGRIASHKQKSMKKRILAAYEAYQRREPNSLNALVTVSREFVYRKLYNHIESKFRDIGTAETADDWAQDVVIKIWQQLTEGYEGTAANYYSYLNKAAFNKRVDATDLVLEKRATMRALTVPVENDDSEEGTRDNPAIYNQETAEETPYPILPDWINTRDPHDLDAAIIRLLSIENAINQEHSEVDATTAKYFDDPESASVWRWRGFNYAEIAAILSMTPNAVELRVKRMRNKVKKEEHRPFEAAAD